MDIAEIETDLIEKIETFGDTEINWEKITAEDLDIEYSVVLPKTLADEIFENLKQNVRYYEGELTRVKVFGKLHDIPRQQAAYGDPHVTYKFSGIQLPAMPWTRVLKAIRNFLSKVTGIEYNFVLVNKYRSGNDHIGEHRDAEPELDPTASIVSISLGQSRTFVLKHGDVRKKLRDVPLVKMELEHGSILIMNPPTNQFWYHSVPVRKRSNGERINLTFRKINI